MPMPRSSSYPPEPEVFHFLEGEAHRASHAHGTLYGVLDGDWIVEEHHHAVPGEALEGSSWLRISFPIAA